MASTPGSATGLKKETAAALSYVIGPITGLIFLLLEKDEYVRFHAMQSIVFSVAAFVLNSVLGITVILSPIVPILVLLEFALWLVLIFKASQGEKWEIPYLGQYVYRLLPK
jgi:uncharacterized membrane protein